MEDKVDSTMTWILNFIGKKLSKRKGHKVEVSSLSSRLLRTISIHHLEFTDFTPQSEVCPITCEDDGSKIVPSSGSSAKSEHEFLSLKTRSVDLNIDLPNELTVLESKLGDARDALLSLKEANIKGTKNEFEFRSKLFMDALKLFNSNREDLLDSTKNPNYISQYYDEGFQVPTRAKRLSKSFSFPGFGFSVSATGILLPSYKRMESDSFVPHGTKLKSASSFSNIERIASDSKSLTSFHELRRRREAIAINHRLKDVIMENTKENHRISMDSILHKVPFGHKKLEDMKDRKPNLRNDEGSEGSNTEGPYSSHTKFIRKSFRRSLSLGESLEQYSQLFKTLSPNENAAHTSSKSMQKDCTIPCGKLSKNLGRMLSSPAMFRSYSSAESTQSEAIIESSKFLDGDGLKVSKKLGRLLSSPVTRLNSSINAEQPELRQAHGKKIADKSIATEITSPVLERIDREVLRSESIAEIKESEAHKVSMEEKSDLINLQEAQAGAESYMQTSELSYMPSFDLNAPVEDSAGSDKFLLQEGTEQQHQLSDANRKDGIFMSGKDRTLLDSVRHIMSKSGHNSAPLLSSPPDARLLYDLIEEVFSEICENFSSPCRWLPLFRSKIRSMPEGSYLIDEVWKQAKWHLHAPWGATSTVEDLTAYDFARDDGWMNLYSEADCIALQLEYLILDELFDEAVIRSL